MNLILISLFTLTILNTSLALSKFYDKQNACLLYNGSKFLQEKCQEKINSSLLSVTLKRNLNSSLCFKISCKFYPSDARASLLKLLLLLSGDIETNPGPKTKFPCLLCSRACTWRQEAIQCDDCDGWYHCRCLGMNSGVYSALGHSDASWHCVSCGVPQFTPSFFADSSSFLSANSFSTLSSSANSPIGSPSSFTQPLKSSSPISKATNPTPKSSKKKLEKNLKNPKSKINTLTIMNINFQSCKNKADEFQLFLDEHKPDIVVGTETWLNPQIKDSEIFPETYNIFRNDRTDGYGGVLIAIKNTIVCERIPTKENLEHLACKMFTSNNPPIILNAIYRPPSSSLQYTLDICDEIEKTYKNHKNSILWTLGDFNLPDIDWTLLTTQGNRNLLDINQRYIDMSTHASQEQAIKEPTRDNNILDLFFTNRPNFITNIKNLPALGDHDIPFIKTNISVKLWKKPKRQIWLWNKTNIPDLHKNAQYFKKSFLSKHSSKDPVDTLWICIKSNLISLMENFVPTKTTSTQYRQPWLDNTTQRLCKQKNRWYQKTKKSTSQKIKNKYQELKRQCRKACREARHKYVNSLFDAEGNCNKNRFWQYVKSKRKDNVGNPPLYDSDHNLHTDPCKKAEILNSQFSSVFSPIHKTNIFTGETNYNEMDTITVNENGVYKLLHNINPHKATGPDTIPGRLLKELAAHLAPVYTILFQASLNQGTLPSDWKTAHVTPIFKKGDPKEACNYRPVSLTSISCKLLEHIIHSNVMKHLDLNKILTSCQHGFRKRRSCETQLISTFHDLSKGIDHNKQTDVILLDFSKAFDKVSHFTLLNKLHLYGINKGIILWMRDFLLGRTQRVLIDNKYSSFSPVTSGVPQGSVLGPLLFLIYINDLPSVVSKDTHVKLFADDSVVYRSINSKSDCEILQKDLNNLQQWERENLMHFHPDKCQLITITNKKRTINFDYTIHNQIIEKTNQAKYLGIHLSNNLSFNYHIDSVCKKAHHTLSFLQRNFGSCHKDLKIKLYKSHVRPLLEYCSSVWDPFTQRNIKKIEAVQRRGARFVHSSFSYLTPVTPLLQDLKWHPLRERRAQAKLMLLFKAQKNLVDIPLNHHQVSQGHDTRNSTNYFVPFCRTNIFKNSFHNNSIQLWNSLPLPTRLLTSVDSFHGALITTTIRHHY